MDPIPDPSLFGAGTRSHVIEYQRSRTRRIGNRQIVRRMLDDPEVRAGVGTEGLSDHVG